jgi:alpha-tubulin suppressor-like RCC1 family protein
MANIGFKLPTGEDIGDMLVPRDIFSEGGLWTCGYNWFGQLGNNDFISKANTSSLVQTVAGGSNWKQVAAGNNHTAAIKTDGTLWLCGYNINGQIGDNTTVNRTSPVQTIAGGTNWKQVACGGWHTAAIKTDGTLWMWGYNGSGNLGDNTYTQKASPVQTIAGGTNWKQVACGAIHTAAIKTDGTLWTWGYNLYGNLGDSTTVWKSSPVQTIAGGTNWKQVAAGYQHTAAIKTDGTLWLWGHGGSGRLGDSNITTVRSSPVQTIAGGTNWKQVSCGGTHTAAIKTDGTLWTWGSNYVGQLGDSTKRLTSVSNRSSPVQTVAGGTNWKQVSCGGEDGGMNNNSTSAIKTDGTLWIWGSNTFGQLGDSTTNDKSVPIQTITGGNNWKQVSLGARHTAAIQDDM